MKNHLVKGSLLFTLVIVFVTSTVNADVGDNKLCDLGNTCEIEGQHGKVTYSVTPSNGTDFTCYVKSKGKYPFEGKLKGEDGFKFASQEVIAHKNPILFTIHGIYTNNTRGSIVLQKQKISIFVRENGNAEVVCDKFKQ